MTQNTITAQRAKANADLRQEMKSAGVFAWEVAEGMGLTEFSFCRHMRRELPEEQKNQIRAVIGQLKEVHS